MLWRVVAVAAVLAAAGAAHAATRAGNPLQVTNFGDARAGAPSSDHGPDGSLRKILLDVAKSGDTITFAPGTVQLNFPIRVGVPNITIDGTNAAVQYRGGQTNKRENPEAAVVLALEASRITVRNLTFDDGALAVGGIAGSSFSDVHVDDDHFIGRRSGVLMEGTQDSTVRRNTFEPSQEIAVSYVSDENLLLEGNVFHNGGNTAISGFGTRITVRGNTFADADGDLHGNGLTVEQNTLQTAVVSAIDQGDGKAVVVRGNTGSGGIRVSAGRSATVSGQQVDTLQVDCRSAWRNAHRATVTGNTVASALVSCEEPGTVQLAGNTFKALHLAHGRDVRVDANTIRGGAGVLVERGVKARFRGTTMVDGSTAGVTVREPATVTLEHVHMGGNAGPGIVRGGGVPQPPALRYDREHGKLRGAGCPGCLVELYASEAGAKQGNPGRGEGVASLGTVRVRGDGTFVFPARGQLDCPATGLVTATATRPGRNTSGFARDASCSCVAAADVTIDSSLVPATGFANFGAAFEFPPGTTIGEAELTDAKTKAPPPQDALGPTLTWEWSIVDTRARTSGWTGRDWHAIVRPAKPGTRPDPAVKATWHLVVPYTPPRGVGGCPAKPLR